MKRWLFLLVLLVGLAVLSACSAGEKATPAPASPTAAVKAAWEQEWERVLAAAQREGKVTIIADMRGPEHRQALTEAFERKYGITVEHLGIASAEAVPRIQTERAGGQYLWDIHIGGHMPMLTLLKEGIYDPVEPALILPEVKDGKNWLGGDLGFVDKNRTGLLMFTYSGTAAWVNTDMVKPDEIKSWKDLLDPRWRGKIVAADPRVAGPGQAAFSMFYAHKDLGPDFIRELVKHELVFARDYGTIPRELAQGKYAICLGCPDAYSTPLMKQGLPIRPVDPRKVREGGYLSGGNGVLWLLNRPPHPNAAKVYINWLLSKEGQTTVARPNGFPSRRVDVPNSDWTPPELTPDLKFWNAYTEEGAVVREPLVSLLREILRD
ncbi:MAG TPA: extracellular solute-binding protein [Dehalococcoidia bacterium]|nr:extracellular solute-binding protein [Dehalococcoidia bacterium]